MRCCQMIASQENAGEARNEEDGAVAGVDLDQRVRVMIGKGLMLLEALEVMKNMLTLDQHITI